jgi:hypothetical protein
MDLTPEEMERIMRNAAMSLNGLPTPYVLEIEACDLTAEELIMLEMVGYEPPLSARLGRGEPSLVDIEQEPCK